MLNGRQIIEFVTFQPTTVKVSKRGHCTLVHDNGGLLFLSRPLFDTHLLVTMEACFTFSNAFIHVYQ